MEQNLCKRNTIEHELTINVSHWHTVDMSVAWCLSGWRMRLVIKSLPHQLQSLVWSWASRLRSGASVIRQYYLVPPAEG